MEPPTPPLQDTFHSVGEALADAGRQFGDREAYVHNGERLSFAEWSSRSEALAAELVRRGLRPGQVVAMMLPSGIDFAICYAAIVRAGAVATALSTRLGPREVDAILHRCEPAMVIRDPGTDLPRTWAHLPALSQADLPGIWHRRTPEWTAPPVALDDPAVIIWTSGTTGVPKGAWYDHRRLLAAVRSAGVMSAPFDRRLFATPFAHAGYMAKLWDQVAWGITIVTSPAPWSAASMLDVLRRERISVASAVPTQWAKLLQQPDLGQAGLPGLRLCTAATAPASPELVQAVTRALGVPLVVRYAMTESPSIAGTAPEDPPEVQARTVGRPQAGMEVMVASGDGAPSPAGAVGSIRVRGDCVMRGYWRDPERTAAALDSDGWLDTGDLGRLTEDGNLVLCGRSGDMYIRGGYKVHPLEVENVLSEHSAVRAAAVVGSPAPVIGEIGVAFVVPENPSAPPALEELREWSRRRLADYKAPDRLVLVDELPLTAMLKIDRRPLRERAAQ